MLNLAYAVSFGSELAVVSMLPEFFEHTFNIGHNIAGPIAASYPLMNLVSRPAGGFISDKIGSRKWTLTILIGGVGIGYLLMSQISNGWLMALAIVMTMSCAFFVFGAAGATFGIAPLLKRSVTGQITGNIGAYGSVGSVIYATTYSLLPQTHCRKSKLLSVLGLCCTYSLFPLCLYFARTCQDLERRNGRRSGFFWTLIQ